MIFFFEKGKLLYFACVVTGQAIESGFPSKCLFVARSSCAVDGTALLQSFAPVHDSFESLPVPVLNDYF
jgi:hypothetical protein